MSTNSKPKSSDVVCNRCKKPMMLQSGGIVPDERGRYETDWDNKDYDAEAKYLCICGNTLRILYQHRMPKQ